MSDIYAFNCNCKCFIHFFQIFAMPLFGNKKSKKSAQRIPPPVQPNQPPPPPQPTGPADDVVYSSPENEAHRPPANETRPPPKLMFHCQLAHGSPTGVISGFSNVKELYEKIAACYDMDPAQVAEPLDAG